MTARAMPKAGLLAAVAAATVLAGADVELVRDDRLRIVRPPERAEVKGPFRLRWAASGVPPGGGFAVFVDRPPMRPGQDLGALARRDPQCRRLPDCPDRRWLAAHGVHVTRRSALRLPALPLSRGRPVGNRRRHEILVVLLDRHGRRVGEGAWRRVVFSAEWP